MIKVLFVGLATDGPNNVAFLPKNEKDLSLFGSNFTERYSITPTASSVNLSYTPWTNPLNSVNGIKSYLFSPILSGSALYFGSLGSSGNYSLDLNYTPYVGKSDIIFAARKYNNDNGKMPYIARLGGTYATLNIGNWQFCSRYAGSKYNKINITWDGSTLTVSGLAPNFPPLTYTGINNLKELVYRDYTIGTSPVQIINSTSTLSSFSAYLSGGTDGSFSDQDVDNFLQQNSIPIDVTHVVLLTNISSSMVTSIGNSMSLSNSQPRMFFGNVSYTAPASSWVANMKTILPYRNNMLANFVGSYFTILDNKETERYAVEGASISFAGTQGFNLTNIPVKGTSFSPVLGSSDLDTLNQSGFVPLMRYIRNDISVYQGVTSLNSNTFLYSSKLAEILGIAQPFCYAFLGSILSQGRQNSLEQQLSSLVSQVNFFVLELLTIIVKDDSMYVTISGFLPDEILNISFVIKNN
jgi:hypothetical protein